jgi:hypothetical protein
LTKQEQMVTKFGQVGEATADQAALSDVKFTFVLTDEAVQAGVARLRELSDAQVGLSYLVAEVFAQIVSVESENKIAVLHQQ